MQKDKSNTNKWAEFTYVGKETKFIIKPFKDSSIKVTYTTNNTIDKALPQNQITLEHKTNLEELEYINSHAQIAT